MYYRITKCYNNASGSEVFQISFATREDKNGNEIDISGELSNGQEYLSDKDVIEELSVRYNDKNPDVWFDVEGLDEIY